MTNDQLNGIISNIISTAAFVGTALKYDHHDELCRGVNIYFHSDIATKNEITKCLNAFRIRVDKNITCRVERGLLIVFVPSEREFPFLMTKHHNAFMREQPEGEILLGVDDEGYLVHFNIADSKSILVGGTSGSGKSVAMHAIALSLVSFSPKVDIYFADLKKTEFMGYSEFFEVDTTYEEVLSTLKALKAECKRRYEIMSEKGIRKATTDDFHYIVYFIDEYAELTSIGDKKEIDNLVASIAQVSRACGIFLVIATQHPTNNNLSTAVRANLQTRIGLMCELPTQSMNIIGTRDCVNLLGKGDALLSLDGRPATRLQVYNVEDEDIHDNMELMRKNGCTPVKKKSKYAFPMNKAMAYGFATIGSALFFGFFWRVSPWFILVDFIVTGIFGLLARHYYDIQKYEEKHKKK